MKSGPSCQMQKMTKDVSIDVLVSCFVDVGVVLFIAS
jgi:hypothetical protein